jgi:hypothetical protein
VGRRALDAELLDLLEQVHTGLCRKEEREDA